MICGISVNAIAPFYVDKDGFLANLDQVPSLTTLWCFSNIAMLGWKVRDSPCTLPHSYQDRWIINKQYRIFYRPCTLYASNHRDRASFCSIWQRIICVLESEEVAAR